MMNIIGALIIVVLTAFVSIQIEEFAEKNNNFILYLIALAIMIGGLILAVRVFFNLHQKKK